ncbi:MAG: MFS transporter [Chloroflexi bacterium]|nr:MFS transporter [Chloroflexota bacterium]
MTTTALPATHQQNKLISIIVAYLAFILIGMASTSALLGIAWTPMQSEFGQPLDAVGLLLAASTLGYLSSSFLTGSITGRIGIGMTLLAGGLLTTISLGVAAFFGSYLLLLPLFVLLGVGSGFIDAGLNAYVAEHHSERTLNWLHACFGIGATVSPLIVTAILDNDLSWRAAFVLVTLISGVVTLAFLFMRGRWRTMAAQAHRADGGQGVRMSDTLRIPAVWLGIVLFFFYAGMETSPGQWMFPLYNQSRGIPEATAGFWVSFYWGSFTIGRIFFGAIISYIKPNRLMRLCLIGTMAGAALIWWSPTPDVGFLGLALFGFSQAPMFPVFISQTLARVGARHTPNAIGFQVAGAGIGIAGIPALIGFLAARSTLEIIPPFLFGASILVVILYEISARVHMREK